MLRTLRLEQSLVPVQIALLLGAVALYIVYRQVEYARLPGPVREVVEGMFPDTWYVSHRIETEDGRTLHEVTVRRGGELIDVTVGPGGELVEVERAIPEGQLPRPVHDAIRWGHPGFQRVERAEEIHRGGALVGYEVKFHRTRDRVVEAHFNPHGGLIRKTEK
jgi:hypothetical protein